MPVLIDLPWRNPSKVLAAFAEEPFACGLIGEEGWSYVLRAPQATLILDETASGDPFAALRGLLGARRERDPSGPPFQGGLIALAAYEFGARIEPLSLARTANWPDLAAGRYGALLAFHSGEGRAVAIGEDEAQARAAAGWLDLPSPDPASGVLAERFSVREPAAAYEAIVAQVRERIAAGELFQANLARAWDGRLTAGVAPIDLFRRLLAQSPAPFAAYLRLPRLALVSNSPERFLSLRGGEASTQPIKGTRPRGGDPAADAALAAELVASAKDRAENLMIVDLMRNDLSRVCIPGTVETGPLFALKSFANVHHLVSRVRGRLAAGRDGFDLLRAAFPPGSITGAPKVQAMKLISALEPPRGPYCGALLWAGFDGDLESSVLIRCAALAQDANGWLLEARAGAGITAGSDPAAEAAETEDKMAALKRALTEALA